MRQSRPNRARSHIVKISTRVLALAFGLLLALALIEIIGRAAMGFAPLPAWAQDFNNRVGYELRPHQEYVYVSKSGEFEITVRHNSRGLHDVEHDLADSSADAASERFRILILSDSYGHAREVPLADNFARQLELLLNADATDTQPFEVINAGHFGLGTTQEYLYYTVEGRRYDPDLVLLGFYVGNDVVDNYAPLVRAWNDVDAVDFPTFDQDGTLHQPGMAAERRALSWLRHNIYFANVLAAAMNGTGQPDRVEVGDPDTVTAQSLRVPMGVYLPPDDTWTEAWNVTGIALSALQAAVEADGAHFAVFVIPDRRQIYEADWQHTLDHLPELDPTALDRDRPTQTIMTLLAERDIFALNLLESFRATDERLYFVVDGHFNPAGHRLTAEILARELRAAELVPDAHSRDQ